MIELIFAIVIMGIVMMSAPMLINRSVQSSYTALQQESIAAAAAQIDMIMTAEWDHMDTNATIGEPVLKTVSTIFNQCAGSEAHPKGVTSASGRYCKGLGGPAISYSASSILSTEGVEGGIYDDVDDYNNQSYSVKVYHNEIYATHLGDYIDRNISITSHVYYGEDTPKDTSDNNGNYATSTTFANPFRHIKSNTTNIKLINVSLTSSAPASEISDKSISLSAFMCNIGAPRPNIISNESSL